MMGGRRGTLVADAFKVDPSPLKPTHYPAFRNICVCGILDNPTTTLDFPHAQYTIGVAVTIAAS
jgi:hypothetical protein